MFRVERARGPVWYAKSRPPDGRRVQKKLGPAWTGRGTLPGLIRTGATFADACAEYLSQVEHRRGVKPSTLRGYRSANAAHLLPAFGPMPLEDVTTAEIELWMAGSRGSVRTRNKLLIQLHGILVLEDVKQGKVSRLATFAELSGSGVAGTCSTMPARRPDGITSQAG